MAPAFLNGVAAPQLHRNFMDLITLWSVKMQLSAGHSFSVKQDIFDTALEAIWAAVFGNEGAATVTSNQIKLLSSQKNMRLPLSADEAAEFQRAPAPPEFHAVLELTNGLEHVAKSPFPKTTGFIQRYIPSGRKNLGLKKRFTVEEIAKAEKRMKDSEGKEAKITNAVDHMLRREKMAAEKLQRAPQYHSNVMIDEVSLLMPSVHRTQPPHTNNRTDLWSSHSWPRHYLHHPILGRRIPRRIPACPNQTPRGTAFYIRCRTLRRTGANSPRDRHNPVPLPRRRHRRGCSLWWYSRCS